ncbi:MAG: GNAT family N-acetyltransferase [Cypionkella sp.]|uniref:GNAT family N-acetyltransferase n=1 Tax=Cypionkella sp. TaxID=2811411 RepID=UPI002AB85F24|nr:GNAT family N-acetyltransferase [Cypionkella sp.]MDZ4311056.1 GNAT family N-acetyltransferase [Cypionkella sp.]
MIELTGIPVIETANLRLRGPKTADFEVMASFLASPRAQYIGGPVSRALAWRSFGHLTGHWLHRGYSMFVLADKTTDAALGMAGPWFPEGWPEPELGWSIWAPEAEGRGLAHEAALATRRFAYDSLGWKTAISLIAEANHRSQALAQRMGCTRDGTFIHETFGASQIWRHPAPETLQ